VYKPESIINACLIVSVLVVGVVIILKSSESSTMKPSRYQDTVGAGSPVNSTLTLTFEPSEKEFCHGNLKKKQNRKVCFNKPLTFNGNNCLVKLGASPCFSTV